MNTRPLFCDLLEQARACEDRANRRLAFIRRIIREAETKLKAYQLALTDAALKGRFPSEGSMARMLEGQLEGLRVEERVAEADLYAAVSQRRSRESAA